jgi:hypothetical protein
MTIGLIWTGMRSKNYQAGPIETSFCRSNTSLVYLQTQTDKFRTALTMIRLATLLSST